MTNFELELGMPILIILSIVLIFVVAPYFVKLVAILAKKSNFKKLGTSSQIRLIRQLHDAVLELSSTKTGAIIAITHKQQLENFRTDGVIIDANISSGLIISIFNKHSPLHDGAIIINDNKITYASTFFKITSKSLDNRYGARHRAALGISEQSDALTIVVSEQTGTISFAKNGRLNVVKIAEFQERLTEELKKSN